jgi:hypothetical protein
MTYAPQTRRGRTPAFAGVALARGFTLNIHPT